MSIEIARAKVLLNPQQFRPDFYSWLNLNYVVYEAFEREADKIRGRGRSHYSHRTIWEFLRHETALREASREYKLNDHFTKDCALLYSMLHPEAKAFFEFRGLRSAGVGAAA